MLDAIKRMGAGGNRQQAGELQDLISAAREERAALSAMLTQVQLHSPKVAAAGKAVQQVEEKAAKAVGLVEELSARLGAVDDEVQLKVGAITNLLEDVRVNMETVGEQRAVLDHALENLSKLTEMIASGQSTLRALQAERELAERIERGIKSLRSKTA